MDINLYIINNNDSIFKYLLQFKYLLHFKYLLQLVQLNYLLTKGFAYKDVNVHLQIYHFYEKSITFHVNSEQVNRSVAHL